LEVRLGYQEKSEFVEACDTQGDTPSSALRRFIRGYVRRADADLFASAWRGLGRRWKMAFGLSSVGLIALAITGVTVMRAPSYIEPTDMDALNQALATKVEGPSEVVDPQTLPSRLETRPSPIGIPNIDRKTFDRFDRDKSGVLEKGEILPSDHHLHRALDIDGSAGISPKEFYTKGNMQYRIAKDWQLKKSGDSYQMKHEGKLEVINLSFDLKKMPPLINPARPMEETVIEQHDRTVIWADGAAKPHSTWTNDTHPVRP